MSERPSLSGALLGAFSLLLLFIDATAASLDSLLALAHADAEERGLGDAPWPPHFAKQPGEPKRVQPSRARSDT